MHLYSLRNIELCFCKQTCKIAKKKHYNKLYWHGRLPSEKEISAQLSKQSHTFEMCLLIYSYATQKNLWRSISAISNKLGFPFPFTDFLSVHMCMKNSAVQYQIPKAHYFVTIRVSVYVGIRHESGVPYMRRLKLQPQKNLFILRRQEEKGIEICIVLILICMYLSMISFTSVAASRRWFPEKTKNT